MGDDQELPARILIVDDHEDNVELLRARLESWGYATESAMNGMEALSKVEDSPPDLILLDVMMAGLDGFEVAGRLAADESTAAIPVAFLSARAEQADVTRGLELGGVAYFTKPFDPIRLTSEVESLVERLRRQGLERVRADARARVRVERGPDV